MTTYYVDDSATGLNAGTDWTNAWTSISSATASAVAGDTILVAYTHAQTTNGPSFAQSRTNLIKIISTDPADDSYRAGAEFNGTSTLTWSGGLHFMGVDFLYPNEIGRIGSVGFIFEDGTLRMDELQPLNSDNCNYIFRNATVDIEKIDQQGSTGTWYEFINCTVSRYKGTSNLIADPGTSSVLKFKGCDLSDWGTIQGSAAYGQVTIIQDCLMAASFVASSGTFSDRVAYVLVERSSSDTNITVPALGLTEFWNEYGTVKSTLAVYRTDGADDGEQANEFAWEMTTNATAEETFNALISPPSAIWIDGGASTTLTFYVASGATLNDDDFWVEVMTPDETATATTQSDVRTTQLGADGSAGSKPDFNATPTALTTDSSSTWNGSGVGTKQKISITFTPDIAGPVKARFCLAKPSTTVYVDPKIEVS